MYPDVFSQSLSSATNESHSFAHSLLVGIPPFFMGIGENKGRESEAPTLRGYLSPRVLCDKPLACFCLPLQAFPLFLAKSLTETVGLANKFKNVSLAREPV